MATPPQKAPEHLRFAAVAVDVLLFGIREGVLHALVVPIHRPPYYEHSEGFIGGLIDASETADEAVLRHLRDKAQIKNIYTEQLYTFSELERDPRNRVISVAYMGCVTPTVIDAPQKEGNRWVPVSKLHRMKLPYDHSSMLVAALKRLHGKLAYTTIAQYLLPPTFTLTELQSVYEIVRNETLDKRNFRKKILSLNMVKETGALQEGVKNRPAQLYAFKSKVLKELELF